MRIVLDNIGKRFGSNWIFRNISLELNASEDLAILGNNGSGKSTLLKIMSGISIPSEGKVVLTKNNRDIPTSDYYKYMALSAPYQELPSELSLSQLINFNVRSNAVINTKESQTQIDNLIDNSGLRPAIESPLSQFSSGMLQKAKFILALQKESPLLFLDEPTSNLDQESETWMINEIKDLYEPAIILASNKENEHFHIKRKKNIAESNMTP